MSEMEPVAWQWEEYFTEWGTGTNGEYKHSTMWGDEKPADHPDIRDVTPLVRLSDAEARIAELEEDVGRLVDENSDLRCEPWPEWASAVLKVIRKHSGYDGYDDATEGVDMPLELSEHLSEMEAEAGRWKARAEAAEALLKEAGDGLHDLERYVALNCFDQWLPEGHAKTSILSRKLDAARAIHDKIGVKDE